MMKELKLMKNSDVEALGFDSGKRIDLFLSIPRLCLGVLSDLGPSDLGFDYEKGIDLLFCHLNMLFIMFDSFRL